MSQGDSWLHISFCHHLCLHQLTGSHFCEYASHSIWYSISVSILLVQKKEPKLHQVTEWRKKKPREKTRLSRGTSSPMTNDQTVYDYDSEYDPVPSGWRLESSRRYGERFVEDQCQWPSQGRVYWNNLCWHFRDALWSCLGQCSLIFSCWVKLFSIGWTFFAMAMSPKQYPCEILYLSL